MLILHALLVSYQYNEINTRVLEASILILFFLPVKDPKRKTLSKELVEVIGKYNEHSNSIKGKGTDMRISKKGKGNKAQKSYQRN